MMRYVISVFLFLCLFSETKSQEKQKKTWSEMLSPTALLEWETAYAFDDQEIQKSEMIFRPEFNIGLGNKMRWVVIGRFYAEFMDNLEPGRPDQSEVSGLSQRLIIGDRFEAELREFYFDVKIKKAFVTMGKQQIVWGKADGLRVLDLVNPFNFREFLLDEFEDSRLPLWSIRADIPIKALSLQVVWIPDQSYHDLPDVGGAYTLGGTATGGDSVRRLPLDKPDRWMKDSDLGLRLSTFQGGWDLTFNYLYSYDDFPIYFRSVDVQSAIISPRYERNHLLGTTFSNAFGSYTFRGELGYFSGKYFSHAENSSLEMIRSNQLMSVAGVDYSGISNTTLSSQLFMDWVGVGQSLAGRESVEATMSLLVTRTFLNETLTAELIWIQSFNRLEGFVQAKIKYLLRSNLTVWAGGEWVYGPGESLIGQFDERDRVYFGMELGF